MSIVARPVRVRVICIFRIKIELIVIGLVFVRGAMRLDIRI